MKNGALVVAVLGLGSLGALRIEAQEAVRVGIDVAANTGTGLDPEIGATLHLGQHVALRPQVRYSRSEYRVLSVVLSGSVDLPDIENPAYTSEAWGGGLDVLYYLRRTSDLSPYLFAGLDVARVTDSRTATTYEGAFERKTTAKGWRAGLGLQYGLKDRLAIFGELGLRHGWADEDSSTATFGSTLGVRIYLK